MKFFWEPIGLGVNVSQKQILLTTRLKLDVVEVADGKEGSEIGGKGSCLQ